MGIIFQIDDKKCLYFIHFCAHYSQLLFLLTYHAEHGESISQKKYSSNGGILEKGGLKTWRIPFTVV